MEENSYGIKKRMDFLHSCMKYIRPKNVLDFGCGTGSALTIPLAKAFPEIQFVGLESDSASVQRARSLGKNCPNLTFEQQLSDETKFDLIIASEVIEHIENYQEALAFLHSHLKAGGHLFFTLPNGYGPFEFVSFVESVLRRLKQLITRKKKRTKAVSLDQEETLANSPHINFFRWKEILSLIRQSGFRIDSYRGRTLFCGLILSPFIDASAERKLWNAAVADRISPKRVSGWMFLLSKSESPISQRQRAEQGILANFKRNLNLVNAEGAQ